MESAKSSKQVFEIQESYPHNLSLIQKYHMKPDSDFLIALIGNLSQCQFEKNTVLGDHLDIISQQNNLVEVLLALFILW